MAVISHRGAGRKVCVCVHHSIGPDRQGSSFQRVLLEIEVLFPGVGVISYISIHLYLCIC